MPCSSVSVVNFELVNAGWEVIIVKTFEQHPWALIIFARSFIIGVLQGSK